MVGTMPRVIVVGGSIGGLAAALSLRGAGCDVRVFERSASALQARGAGIVALRATLRCLTEWGGYRPEDVCSATGWIRFLNRDGSVRHEQRYLSRFSSWHTIHRSLLALLGPGAYRLGSEMVAFEPAGGTVTVSFAGSRHEEADLLVCADGVGSAARARLMPQARPAYAGYVAWRGTVPERDLPAASRDVLGDALTYQVLPGSHVLVYPIPGHDGSLAPGERLVNIVWYVNVPAGDDLDRLMTGRDGVRRAVSLPPGAATGEAVARMRRSARECFAAPIADVMTAVPEPFVQVICDLEVPRMACGRVCLIGDAAFVVRPHAAAGTAKAADDGWALAEELRAAGGDVPTALAAWEERQLRVGRQLLARTREIGDSSQFTGGFRPGDPRLIFGLHQPGDGPPQHIPGRTP